MRCKNLDHRFVLFQFIDQQQKPVIDLIAFQFSIFVGNNSGDSTFFEIH